MGDRSILLPAVLVPHGRLDEGRVAAEGEEGGDLLGGEGAPVVLDGRRLAREPLGQEPTEPANPAIQTSDNPRERDDSWGQENLSGSRQKELL